MQENQSRICWKPPMYKFLKIPFSSMEVFVTLPTLLVSVISSCRQNCNQKKIVDGQTDKWKNEQMDTMITICFTKRGEYKNKENPIWFYNETYSVQSKMSIKTNCLSQCNVTWPRPWKTIEQKYKISNSVHRISFSLQTKKVGFML